MIIGVCQGIMETCYFLVHPCDYSCLHYLVPVTKHNAQEMTQYRILTNTLKTLVNNDKYLDENFENIDKQSTVNII